MRQLRQRIAGCPAHRLALVSAAAGVSVLLGTSPAAHAQAPVLYSFEATLNSGTANGFDLEIGGTYSQASFASLFSSFSSPGYSVSSSAGATTIAYTGDSIGAGTTLTVGYSLPDPVSDGSGTGLPPTLSAVFLNNNSLVQSNSTTLTSYDLVTGTPTSSTPNRYLTLFSETTGSNTGQWFELPILPGQTITPQFVNDMTSPSLTLSNAGFMLSPTLIPLDNLNFGELPPPGSPGSTFQPLPNIDGTGLSPDGGSTSVGKSFGAAPDAASFPLIVSAAITASPFMMAARRRRIRLSA
jgi:hypothetical protein